jgi:hypothetical protein
MQPNRRATSNWQRPLPACLPAARVLLAILTKQPLPMGPFELGRKTTGKSPKAATQSFFPVPFVDQATANDFPMSAHP